MSLSFRPSTSVVRPQHSQHDLAVSQPSSSKNGLSFRTSQPLSHPVPTLDLPALKDASRVLEEQFTKDAQLMKDLGEILIDCVYLL